MINSYIKYLLIFTSIYFGLNIELFAQEKTLTFGADSIVQEYYLGFNLIPNTGGALINFALIKPLPYGKRKVILITKDDFIAQAGGKRKSLANPYKIDFFKKYQIKSPSILDHLWKLRYTEFPYQTSGKPEKGWSQNLDFDYLPTAEQMKMLQKFGIESLRDYFYGENAFLLLQAIQDPQWLKNYKGAF